MKEKAMKVILNCIPGIFNVQIAEKTKKDTHVFSLRQSDFVSRRGRTQNVKLFPASHAQMIIWSFLESLRSPSPSPFSLLKFPFVDARLESIFTVEEV